ncbi:uncharacterized protein B0H18DRAFT_648874 [Fomitopsis serialis]|uniref:uncharacterized protein n=1 Tax=Fomitopsis serialis TaxID=139415 RepID=UPI00200746A1|nr:uncharacterized protein B0H18DRAFT_648874 [Neoantrodia serialis]KAH9919229.1 hypothetical protein B0H18DRAFT_648874 [Neoantrodia serialis]
MAGEKTGSHRVPSPVPFPCTRAARQHMPILATPPLRPSAIRLSYSRVLRSTSTISRSWRGTAVKHLSTAWPTTLQGWRPARGLGAGVQAMQRGFRYPLSVAAINFVREVDARWQLLLSAFYDLSRYQVQILGEGPRMTTRRARRAPARSHTRTCRSSR